MAKAALPEAYQLSYPQIPSTYRSFDFMDLAFHMRQQFICNNLKDYSKTNITQSSRSKYFAEDIGTYMPSDAVFYMLEEQRLFDEK